METQPGGGSQRTSALESATLVVDTPEEPPSRQRFAKLRGGAPQIVPSLLLCDFGHLADEVHKLEAAGVRSLHLDVMDGHFVPNLTYGLPIVKAVRQATNLAIETHLMISEPERYAAQFFKAGADAITFHFEAATDARGLLEELRRMGAVAGLAYNPATPLAAIEHCLDVCDLVLTMSVTPGFGGQEFESVALEKLGQLRSRVSPEVMLEVDGGVNDRTVASCAEAGAHLMVVGSAIFAHPDYSQSIATLTRLAGNPRRTR